MTNIILGEKAWENTGKTSPSNDTVKRRIRVLAADTKDQTLTRVGQSPFSALEIDESTRTTNDPNLLRFAKYELKHEFHEEFSFSKRLSTHCTGQGILTC
jgi:hypothetical protein